MTRDPHTHPQPGDVFVADYPHDVRVSLRERVRVIAADYQAREGKSDVLRAVTYARSSQRHPRTRHAEAWRELVAGWAVQA